ncbi:MAG TPA: hypothetical protein VFL53_00620 [Pseudolabrys sp.]|nr:hypothetical protein [Pseudolabrys sp.]
MRKKIGGNAKFSGAGIRYRRRHRGECDKQSYDATSPGKTLQQPSHATIYAVSLGYSN